MFKYKTIYLNIFKMSVLVLGAGLVTAPLIRYLSDNNYLVTLASRTLDNALKITRNYKNAIAEKCDVTKDQDLLENLVEHHDITISMLPYIYHKIPFDLCLKFKKHFLSTSYTQDHMIERKDEILKKNIIVVNESGIFPGLETASIMKVIDELHHDGYTITSLISSCGGIPTPEANTNPFGYKFSWAPRGVLLAERNGATYIKNGVIEEYPTRAEVLNHTFWEDFGENIGKLEGIANRDSLKFIDLYNIKGVQTFIRATLRYPGWTDIIKFFHQLDLLSIEPNPNIIGKSYAEIIANKLNVSVNNLRSFMVSNNYNKHVIDALDFLGLFDDSLKIPENLEQSTLLDALAHRMKELMQYASGEKDMLPMIHRFIAVKNDNPINIKNVISKAIFYGNDNGTAMENTVSLPVAIVAKLILDNKFTTTGLHILNKKELYEPILSELETYGYSYEVTHS